MSTTSANTDLPSPLTWPCQFPNHIFNPPRDAIDAILPLLTKPFEPLGHAVYSKRAFYDLGDGRVVKAGPSVTVYEARAMHFVRVHTAIPVPEVFMVFEHDGHVHIVMELVNGIALREALDHDAAGTPLATNPLVAGENVVSVVRHLREIVDGLRELGRRFPPESPLFGAFPAGPFKNCYTFASHPAEPFKSVDEFHAYFLECLRPVYEGYDIYRDLEAVRRESTEHAPVLTHGDLAPRNLLVKNGRIVGVVDWEAFGWYPDFWERMGISNEAGTRELHGAINQVFGESPFVCRTYFHVDSGLSFPGYW